MLGQLIAFEGKATIIKTPGRRAYFRAGTASEPKLVARYRTEHERKAKIAQHIKELTQRGRVAQIKLHDGGLTVFIVKTASRRFGKDKQVTSTETSFVRLEWKITRDLAQKED